MPEIRTTPRRDSSRRNSTFGHFCLPSDAPSFCAAYYLKKGILKAPLHFQFVLGAAGGMDATVENLVFLKSLLPAGSTWGALGIGKGHLPIMYAALALGGHVRVGMEDNILYSKGVLAKSNVEFVERTKRIVAELNKEIATPAEAKAILGLK